MAKSSKRAGRPQGNRAAERDDGTRWIVVSNHDQPVYVAYGGVTLQEAERLRDALVMPATIIQVKIDLDPEASS